MCDYRKSHLNPEKGASYEEHFQSNPYRAMIWQLEQQILDRILARNFKDQEVRLLDFACGTGRITRYLEGRVTEAVGVDLSPSMLRIARANSQRVEIIEADLTNSDVLGDRQFDLITAFRFFPNAQDSLRTAAMNVLVRHLAPTGYLVFNNHKNSRSCLRRLARLLKRADAKDRDMDPHAVTELTKTAGLEISRVYHLGVFPATEGHMLLPEGILRPLERTMSRCRPLRHFAQNLIYVCRHADTVA